MWLGHRLFWGRWRMDLEAVTVMNKLLRIHSIPRDKITELASMCVSVQGIPIGMGGRSQSIDNI